jgi:hypothetical protein
LTESESAVLPLNYPPTAARAVFAPGRGALNSEAKRVAQAVQSDATPLNRKGG